MVDLYSTIFYGIRFTIEAHDKDSDLLWKVVLAVREWMTRKHNSKEANLPGDLHDWSALKAKTGGQIVGKDVRIASENCLVEEPFATSYWSCRIIEIQKSDEGAAPRQWVTDIGLEPLEKGISNFSCIISYSDRPGFVGECQEKPSISIPRIVKSLLNDRDLTCYNGIDMPSITAVEIKPGEFSDFWGRVKCNDRVMPYIYVSPRNSYDGEPPLLIDPEKLANSVGGNAVVYYASDLNVTEEMNECCTEAYKCYDGALRIYYPNVDETQLQDAYRHRFIGKNTLCEAGNNQIFEMMRRVFAQDIAAYQKFFRLEDCREKRNSIIRGKRLEELQQLHLLEMQNQKARHSRALQQMQELKLDEAIEEEQKRLVAEEKIIQLEIDLADLRDVNYKLNLENDSYRGMAKENADLRRVCDSRLNIKEFPEDPESLAEYFGSMFSDKVAFSKDAYKSIKDCSIPLRDLWQAFFALATTMRDLYETGSGDIFLEFRHKTGIEASRGEGMMTRQNKKLMRQFETEFGGEKIDIEAHITYPRLGQSIHFGYSDKERKVIIGSCGEHMDNYSTKKVH